MCYALPLGFVSITPHTIIDGKYRISRLIGSGGMGAVYEAENTRIRRRVAIKVLHPGAEADAVSRFEREAQAAGQIGCQHIVEVLDLGTLPDGASYMVMEYLEGQTLAERLDVCGSLSEKYLLPIAWQLLDGLDAAHRAGIVHRDLKPENVFLVRDHAGIPDFVKLLDFGISKFSALDGQSLHVTKPGFLMGTPHYMAPEQAGASGGVDARTDIYAAGVILYRALSGRLPFEAEDLSSMIGKILTQTPRPLVSLVPGVDPRWAAMVERAMARSPAARFQSAAELQRALREVAGDQLRGLPTPIRGSIPSVSRSGLPTTTCPWTSEETLPPRPRTRARRAAMISAIALTALGVGIAGVVGIQTYLFDRGVPDPSLAPQVNSTTVSVAPAALSAPQPADSVQAPASSSLAAAEEGSATPPTVAPVRTGSRGSLRTNQKPQKGARTSPSPEPAPESPAPPVQRMGPRPMHDDF